MPSLRSMSVVLALGFALIGCSNDATSLDRAATEDAVAETAAEAFAPGVVDVSCPADLPRGEGEAFTCTVELADELGSVRVAVSQRDDRGSLVVEPVDAVLSVPDVADQLAASLEDEFGRPFEVACGKDEVKLAEVGGTFQCRAKDDTSSRTVRVTVEDGLGTVSFEVLPAGG